MPAHPPNSRLSQQALSAAAAQLPPGSVGPSAVVWLEPTATALQPLSAEDRAQFAAHLRRVASERITIDRGRLSPVTAAGHHPQSARLCGHCGGRCCQHGAAWHGFIDIALLDDWQAGHPGSTPEDAVQAYLTWLPAAHVYGSCSYQGAAGCGIPRQQRAWICNGYACEALQQVQALAEADAQASVVALTLHQGAVARAALVGAGFTQAVDIGSAEAP